MLTGPQLANVIPECRRRLIAEEVLLVLSMCYDRTVTDEHTAWTDLHFSEPDFLRLGKTILKYFPYVKTDPLPQTKSVIELIHLLMQKVPPYVER